MKRLIALSIALAMTGSFAATAQTPGYQASTQAAPETEAPSDFQDAHCGQRADIVSKLGQLFHESSMATGVVNQNAVIEIFVSDRGTWTILATGTDGQSCVVSSGENWESNTMVIGQDV
jgi:hypothetical protein